MRVGAAQICISGTLSKNLDKIASYVEKARKKRLELIVFPECCLTGYLPTTRTKPHGRIDVDDALDEVKVLAREAETALIVGANYPVKGAIYNRSFAISRTGRMVATYDKAHLYEDDVRYYREGRKPGVFRLNGVPFGMQICVDQRHPEGWRLIASEGARVIAHIVHMEGKKAGWKTPVIEAHLVSRAAEDGVFVISSNIASTPPNHLSMIVDPDGIVISRASSGREQLVCGRIDPSRATHKFLKTRREDLFGRLK